jgi:ABC-type phosphate transport system substrate-binding protein
VEIIVHPASGITSVTKAELSKIFLKRLRTWADGERAQPVDQVPGATRESFSRWIHGSSVVTIEVYWKRMIFSGRAVPPVEAADDGEVLEFVRETPGAVGYVTKSAELVGVRKLVLRE